MLLRMNRWLRSKKGQGMVEYALIVALISIVAIAVLKGIGTSVNGKLSTVNSALVAP